MTQRPLFTGLGCLPGQQDLFLVDGEPEMKPMPSVTEFLQDILTLQDMIQPRYVKEADAVLGKVRTVLMQHIMTSPAPMEVSYRTFEDACNTAMRHIEENQT